MSKNYLGSEFKKLGFGYMRLPMIETENGSVYDIEQTKKMTDIFMEKGFTYFDTAYVYIGGTSEVAIKEALVDRYPRDSFQVASKLPLWVVKEESELAGITQTSLDRAGLDYYDFYLLHSMDKAKVKTADDVNAWEFMKKLKTEGKAKHIGFSFHDSAEVLEEILKNHPEMEFVQLQINYLDWENENVQSRKCYEVALKYDMPIIIMEPVKGGTLVNVPTSAKEVMEAYDKNATAASWAIRYAASLENVVTVLSGMSNLEQLEDNTSYMENFAPLNEEEKKVVAQVVEEFEKVPTIPCTDCKYCVEDCPMQINIPKLFSTMNHDKKFGQNMDKPVNMNQFNNVVENAGKPSDCIACGACEGHCPQHIHIIDEIAKIAARYEA